MLLEKCKKHDNIVNIKNELTSLSSESIIYEMKSLSGGKLGNHTLGNHTPLNISNKPIIRGIFGSSLTCFSNGYFPSKNILNDCTNVYGSIKKNGFVEYTKDDAILVCSMLCIYGNLNVA